MLDEYIHRTTFQGQKQMCFQKQTTIDLSRASRESVTTAPAILLKAMLGLYFLPYIFLYYFWSK